MHYDIERTQCPYTLKQKNNPIEDAYRWWMRKSIR